MGGALSRPDARYSPLCGNQIDVRRSHKPSAETRMPTYRGNRGNLLQHWVLAELIALVREEVQPTARLCFIDAHAMSPYAVRHTNPGQTAADFDTVAARLPGQASAYERAWHELSLQGCCRYPSSALLVRHLWQGPLHLLLCEADEDTANEIAEWQRTLSSADTSSELHRGDWRARFRRDLPPGFAAHLISFDPYMYDRHVPPASPNPGNMWPSDILRAGAAVLDLGRGPVVLQLSTYSANNANSQNDGIASIEPVFNAAGLQLATTVRADGNMMSMVFARDMRHIRNAQLQQRFTMWLARATGPPIIAMEPTPPVRS